MDKGDLLFAILHVIAVLFFAWALMLTIPLHLIYTAVLRRGQKHEPETWRTHVRCPECKELVLNEARVCKHCGCKLIPQG